MQTLQAHGAPPQTRTDPIVRTPEVLVTIGVKSKATLYRWIKNGEFPAPVRLGGNAVGWPLSSIRQWIASRKPTIGTDADATQ